MKLVRALAVAATGMETKAERLHAIARTLTVEMETMARTTRHAEPVATRHGPGKVVPTDIDPPVAAHCGDASLRTMQATRSLLTRTIDLLK